MKKLIYLLVCVNLFSCSVYKKQNTNVKESLIKEVQKHRDSSQVVNTNKAINDKVVTQVSSTGNKDLDNKVDAILSKLNTQKTSGSNSYIQRYDRELRQLITDFKIAQTQDKSVNTNNTNNTEITTSKEIDTYIKKKVKSIPWWAYLGIVIWFAPIIIEKISFVSNPLISFAKKILKKYSD